MRNHSAATGLKTWIVIVARTGRPMTAEMTMTAATKWAQSRNNLLGEDTYSCKYVGV